MLARDWVLESELCGMKRLPAEGLEGRSGLGAEAAAAGLEARSVSGIAHDRVSRVGEMDPDLMRTPRLEPDPQQRGNGPP